MEIELKLSLPPEAVTALRQHPALQAAARETHHLISTYFDTSDCTLMRAGFGLRIRQQDGHCVQTLKCSGGAAGSAAYRREWDWPVASAVPDLAVAADLLPALENAPQPVFRTEITRSLFLITQENTVIEAALDEGRVICGDASELVLELELELKSGEPAVLYHLALDLMRVLPLRVDTVSKAARGYAMLTGDGPVPEKAPSPTLGPDITTKDALQILIGGGLHHLLANQPATEAGKPEGLHQMRVAIRRLRGLLVAFEPWLEPHSANRFEAALQHCGQVMGDARDWDVFSMEVLPQALADMPDSWRGGVLAETARRARDSHAVLSAYLESPDYNRLLLSLNAWSFSPGGQGALDEKLADSAPALLDRLVRKVTKRGKHAFSGNDHDLHQLRKTLKKLRYAIDDVASVFPEKPVRDYLKQCKQLQGVLGDFNDAVAAAQLAARLADSGRIDLLPALKPVWDWAARHKQATLAEIEAAWQDFQRATPFW